ncbi:flagellar hook-length control protein FliK [Acidovorax sp. NCPPB 3576]|uniref:flagellar hook-length control protein FliK n=1 Tax=Acidovorax sp. NCPPB 3576 TaxID=2940488 RepID=UPI002349D789|nr:flagellar hook-length control protein FliK [Acidovorax sp. NCPPB 3576]WCM88986.1 flagellar hook-length control protein FliK [Acidovorax sp. NCPPB 3576]
MEPTRINNSHTPHETRGARATGKAGSAHDATQQAAGQGGFSLLLAAMDTTAPGDGTTGTLQTDPGAALASLLPAGEAGALPMDPAALAAQGGQLSAQMPLQGQGPLLAQGNAQQGGLGQSLGRVLGDSAGTGAWANGFGGLMDSGSLVGQTAWMDRATDLSDAAAPTAPGAAPHKGLPSRFSAAAGSSAGLGVDASTAGASAAALRNALGKEDKKPASAEMSGALSAAVAAVAPDRRDGSGAVGVPASARAMQDALGASAPVAGALAEAVAMRASERGAESGASDAQSSRGGTPGAESGMGFSLNEAPAAADGTGVLVDPSQVGAEDQIAEQVAYWVHQKTQNAELTIDREGQPVEVMVSLSGNEAHVTFRSDQANTREWLDSSAAQLRDLLRSEGLELSGVTVGQSGRDGTGASGGDGRRSSSDSDGPARRTQVQAAAGVGAGAALAVKGPAGAAHALDVFA